MSKSWTVGQFGLFRFLLGGFCFVHFSMLIPFAVELFSAGGMISEGSFSPLIRAFPNVLGLYDEAWFVVALVSAAAIASVGLAIGWRDRAAALFIAYVLACLFGRNPLIANPGLPYLGWMLIALLAVPPAPSLCRAARRSRVTGGDWHMPRAVILAAWIVLALTYTYSGYTKLLSPSWVAGDTIALVLDNPLARDTFIREFFGSLPPVVLKGLTWVILYVELLFAPLALSRRLRPLLWAVMLVVQFGFLSLLNFADLTFPMLLMHLLTFDSRWLRDRTSQRDTMGKTCLSGP